MVTKQRKLSELSDREKQTTPIYGRTAMDRPIPKYEIPEVSSRLRLPTT